MKRIYHLSTCSTCQRIIKELNPSAEFEFIDIKTHNIDADTLDWIYSKVGTYEALFSKRAMKFKSMGLNQIPLSELDYRNYMLEEYTFLKRPFILYNEHVFIGNSAQEIARAKAIIAS